MLTKKDYEMLAGVLRCAVEVATALPEQSRWVATDTIGLIVVVLCTQLRQDNPSFDVSEFRKAVYT